MLGEQYNSDHEGLKLDQVSLCHTQLCHLTSCVFNFYNLGFLLEQNDNNSIYYAGLWEINDLSCFVWFLKFW